MACCFDMVTAFPRPGGKAGAKNRKKIEEFLYLQLKQAKVATLKKSIKCNGQRHSHD